MTHVSLLCENEIFLVFTFSYKKLYIFPECAYKRNTILNSVRQHNQFISQGNYIGYMFRLLISHLQAYFCQLSHKMLCTILNSVRQHNHFISQGNYIGYMFRLLISHLQAYFCQLSHKMLCTILNSVR